MGSLSLLQGILPTQELNWGLLHSRQILYQLSYQGSLIPEWPSGFPYFLQFKSEFCNKKLIIWATVSSRPCFCWLYRASPSSVAKNIINLISVLTIWWCSYVEPYPVLLEKGVCSEQCVLLAKLLAFALLHFAVQGQICLLLQVSLDFPLWHFQSPMMRKEIMLKILQARLHQYMNREPADVQTRFRKSRGTRDQIANTFWITEKARELTLLHWLR